MLPTIAAVLLLTILLLTIPVHVVFALKRDDGWRGKIVVYWLFGLTRKTLRSRPEEKARRERRRGRRRMAMGWVSKQLIKKRRYLYSVLRSEGFLRRAVYLFRDLLRSLRPRRFRLQCVIGLDDPADTGRLIGMLSPLRLFAGREMRFGRNSNVAFEVTPDFTGPRCTGYWHASVRFVPVKLIGIFMGFLFSPPVLRATRGLLQKTSA